MARPHVGLLSIGLMRAALEETIAYATERKQFGKVIAAHQLVAAKIAEMATMLDASKLMCYRALSMIDMVSAAIWNCRWQSGSRPRRRSRSAATRYRSMAATA